MGEARRSLEPVAKLLPGLARQLGLEDQLSQAQLMAAWDRLVAEHLPAAAGACRAVGLDGETLVVEADAPIVAQELHLRSEELVQLLGTRPEGARVVRLRIRVRPPRRVV
jgi:2-hydroxychromene-2-carboxylate isomerase